MHEDTYGVEYIVPAADRAYHSVQRMHSIGTNVIYQQNCKLTRPLTSTSVQIWKLRQFSRLVNCMCSSGSDQSDKALAISQNFHSSQSKFTEDDPASLSLPGCDLGLSLKKKPFDQNGTTLSLAWTRIIRHKEYTTTYLFLHGLFLLRQDELDVARGGHVSCTR